MVQNTGERHFETVKYVLKSTVAIKNTLTTVKKNVDIVKLGSTMGIVSGKNLEQQRKFFSTAKRKRKHSVKYTKPPDEEKALFMSQNMFAEEKALFMSQNMFAEETVETVAPLCDTKKVAIKLTKGMTKLCFK